MKKPIVIGSHLSIAKGFYKACLEAQSIGANTFQYFTRNPRGGAVKKLDEEDIAKATRFMEENHFGPLLAHAPYTLNMASSKEDTRRFAREVFTEDLLRLEKIPCGLYNFHPGSHTGSGVDQGIEWIGEILNAGMFEGMNTKVLLECMSGKGTEIGRNFEELARIIEKSKMPDQIGVCLDTCHVYSAGYDLGEQKEKVLEEFDHYLGLDRLMAIHLNDSMTPFASHKDRHEKLNQGSLGEETIRGFLTDPRIQNVPIFLETPNELSGYRDEILWVRDLLES